MALKYDIYRKKQIWKWLLFVVGSLIVIASLIYTNSLVRKISLDERKKVELWADAIERKALLVNYTNDFFKKIEIEERKRVEIWASAMQKLIDADINEDLTFYSKIVQENTNIPVILTDENYKIIASANIDDFSTDTLMYIDDKTIEYYSFNKPIEIKDKKYKRIQNWLFYKESLLFSELKDILNNLVESFFTEIVTNNPGVPVLITDTSRTTIFSFGNIDTSIINNKEQLAKSIGSMEKSNNPIIIKLHGISPKLIFYENSFLLNQLKYYPYVQFAIIGVFLFIAYILFGISRRFEQNQVWVGMAKETAHQLGTPVSSLMAWIQLLKEKESDNQIVKELSEDIKRLENITERFSKIGSSPVLKSENLYNVINETAEYVKSRTSKYINIKIIGKKEIEAPINVNLFSWVIENISKNAIDAMDGKGMLTFELNTTPNNEYFYIDINDTGKGIPKSKQKRIFKPGYTTKNRGWGLGLSLAKRIINDYHFGKIFVKQSSINKGTTFRILLKTKI